MKPRERNQNLQYASAPTVKTPQSPVTSEEIHWRTHEIFLARGGTPGKELEDWLLAEQELKQKSVGADKPVQESD